MEIQQCTSLPKPLLEYITDGCVRVNSQWRYVFVNRPAEKLMDKSREDLLGKTIMAIFPGFEQMQTYGMCLRASMEQTVMECTEYYAPTGTWTKICIFPLRDGFYFLLNDATPRKKNRRAAASFYVGAPGKN